MTYQVVLQIGYREIAFDFSDSTEAVAFANSATTHYVPQKDADFSVIIKVQTTNEE